MNAVDTNVLIYRIDRNDLVKQQKSRALLQQLVHDTTPTVLMWQVVGELMRQLRRWEDQNQVSREVSLRYLSAFRGMFPIVVPTIAVIDRAILLSANYSLSHWDSMILAACIEHGVDTLFTEDMGAPRVISQLKLVNPFL